MVNVNKSVYKSVEILKNGKVIRLDVGMDVIFSVKTGVIKRGNLVDIKGKEEKTRLIIEVQGDEETHEENWELIVMDENSLDIDEEA